MDEVQGGVMRRGGVVVALLAVAGLSAGCMDRLFLFPDRTLHDHPSRHGRATEEVAIKNAKGKWITGWFVRGTTENGAADRKGAALLLHGNGGNLASYLDYVLFLSGAGYDVLAIDYQGFGGSEGNPRVNSLPGDVAAALAWLRGRPDVRQDRVFLYGVSLGTALSITVAHRDPGIRCLVLEGCYLPLLHFYRICGGCFLSWPFAHALHWWMVPEGLDAGDDLRHLGGTPALFITGEDDRQTPVWMAREMYRMKPGDRELWTPAGVRHCPDPLVGSSSAEYRRRVLEFLDHSLGARDHPAPR